MLLSFEICRNRSQRFAYYRFVSITKDFVKVYALGFLFISARGLNLSKYLTSNKTCDENHFVSTFKCQLLCSTTHKFLIIKNVSFRRIRQADIFMQFQQLDKFLLFRK